MNPAERWQNCVSLWDLRVSVDSWSPDQAHHQTDWSFRRREGMRPLILMMVVMLHDDHRLEVTLHPSIFFIYHHIISSDRARHLVTMRKNTGQLVLVTLWTGQQSGAAPCRSSVGFSSPFYPLLKSTVLAVHVQFRSCGLFASVPSLSRRASRLTRCAARSQPGGVRGSEPAAARLLQRHRRGGKREEVSLWGE